MSDRFAEYRRTDDQGGKKKVIPLVIIIVLAVTNIVIWAITLPGLKEYIHARSKSSSLEAITRAIHKKPEDLMISFLDVGQGDCVFIETPNGKTILIDAGEGDAPDNKFARKIDAGRTVVEPYLNALHISRIDVIVATHPHSDHVGGLIYVLEHFEVGELLDPAYKATSSTYRQMLELVKEKNIKYTVPHTGDILDWGTDVLAQVLFREESPWNINDASIVILLQYGKRKFVFTGDAEEDVEKKISLKYGENIKADLYYVGHHGSKTSSSEIFLRCVQPKIAVFSVGSYNTFGHPAPSIVKRIKKFGAKKLYRTDEDGTIVFLTDGEDLRVKTSRD